MEDLNVVSDTLSVMRWVDRHASEDLAVNDVPGVGIRELRSRPMVDLLARTVDRLASCDY